MSESSTNAERNRFLLTSLGIMLIFILTLLVLLAAYPLVLAPPPTLTPTITLTRTATQTPSLTPTITLTSRPTSTRRPTFTLTASLTPSLTPRPSQTPTPPGPPTLTPARPLEGENIYSLLPWSPEKADQVVRLIEDYPNTLPVQARGENNQNYYLAYQYAVDAFNEALLRFPDAPQARQWRWGLAFSLARLGDQQAGEVYASLIAEALNRDETDPSDLTDWFQPNEPRLELDVSEMEPLPGYLSTHLLQINSQGGGAVLLLLETPAGFQTQLLVSDFDFVNASPVEAFASDLNADGVEEVVVYRPAATGDLRLNPPQVFDLSQTPVQALPFDPALSPFPMGTDFIPTWSAQDTPSGGQELTVETEMFPFCPVAFSRSYHWTGEKFEPSPPRFELQPGGANLKYCELVLEHANRTWGAETAAQFAEIMLPDWPPEVDLQGDPYPADAADELRFRLGIYYALAGEFDQALSVLNGIIDNPSSPQSSWIDSARSFLEIYRTPQDLYRACVSQPYCDAAQALKRLVEAQPASASPTLLTTLWEAGVTQRASGYYDFDGDGTTETWITVQHRPGEKLEFWILAPYLEGIKAMRVDTVISDRPDLIPYDEDRVPPVLILDGNLAFQMDRRQGDLLPYLSYPSLPQFYPDRFKIALEAVIANLFQGTDPSEVQRRLLDLREYPGLLCEATWSCDRYYYFLALASELSGNPALAVDTYLQLWWDYSRSPYTTMARLRLRVPLITPTLSPTVTSTLFVTLTPTVTGTPPTATPTADPNATQTPSLTPTLTETPGGTPYPYP